MTIIVRHEAEGWEASITNGVWRSGVAATAEGLQAITDNYLGYVPDDEWSLAVIARDGLAGLTIVSDQPEPAEADPEAVY